MDKILWVKFGWSDHYRGEPVDGNFSALARQGSVGHDAYNFEPAADGTYYCMCIPACRSDSDGPSIPLLNARYPLGHTIGHNARLGSFIPPPAPPGR